MMKTILSNLTERLSLLESGHLTQAEMELLVEDSKELYERLIILRYKLYETNVFVPQTTVEPMFSETTSPMMDEVETPAFDLFEMGEEEPIATEEEEEVPTLHFEAEAPVVPIVETSLFDLTVETPSPTIEMDFTPEEEQVDAPLTEEPEMEESADEFLTTAESDHVEESELEEEHIQHAKMTLDESKSKVAARRKEQAKKAREEAKAKKTARAATPPKRRPQPAAAKKVEKPVETRALNADEVTVGNNVSVNMGKGNMPATIVEINKDDVRIRLSNGLQMVVKAENLRS